MKLNFKFFLVLFFISVAILLKGLSVINKTSTIDKAFGIIFIIFGIIFALIFIYLFLYHLFQRIKLRIFCISRNLTFYKNCNLIIDNFCFNKVYKLKRNIDFHDGISKEIFNCSVIKYIHGILSDEDEIQKNGFYLFLLKNVNFPKFYVYDNISTIIIAGKRLITDSDENNPILRFEPIYTNHLNEAERNELIQNIKVKYNINVYNRLTEDELEDVDIDKYKNTCLVNGKNTALIKEFFNDNVLHDFKELMDKICFVEAKENYLIVCTEEFDFEKRHKINEELLYFIEKLVQHIDDKFKTPQRL